MESINASFVKQPIRPRSSLSCNAYSKVVKTSSVLALPGRWRRSHSILWSRFRDQGHVQYYEPSISAKKMDLLSGQLQKLEKDKSEKKMKKKQMKFLKGLSKDLSTLSQMGFDLGSQCDVVDYHQSESIVEAAELLLEQLQKLRSENEKLESKTKKAKINCQKSPSSSSESSDSECDETETAKPTNLEKNSSLTHPVIDTDVKIGSSTVASCCREKEGSHDNKKKGEKAMRSMTSKLANDCESSSSSSESSDSECDQIIDLKGYLQLSSSGPTAIMPSNTLLQSNFPETKPVPLLASSQVIDTQIESKIGEEEVSKLGARKIEVCMGGKCKRSGAMALLEEFQRVVGVDAAVSSCKCMGKCKEGPNVKVVNEFDAKSLCIGVGLQDVGVIVGKFLGENEEDQLYLTAA